MTSVRHCGYFVISWLVFINSRAFAYDHSAFRTCSDSPFCQRFRSWKGLSERPSLSFESFDVAEIAPLDPFTHLTLNVKSSQEDVSNYNVVLSLHRERGIIRVQVDDTASGTTRRERYRIPHGDVVDKFTSLNHVPEDPHVVTDTGDVISLAVPGIIRIEVFRKDFKLRVFDHSDQLVQVVNGDNLFAFEKYRVKLDDVCLEGTRVDMACHDSMGDSQSRLWRDTFKGKTDEKVYGPSAVGIDLTLVNATSVFGLPEKTVPFNLPLDSEEFRFFNLDVFQYELGSKMPLYGAIPMVSAIHDSTSLSSVLWINPSDTFVSLTRKSDGLPGESIQSTWLSETGVIDMFVSVGSTPKDLIQNYHYITGLPAFPPAFALGFHQSKYGYKSEQEVMRVNSEFDRHEIPMDVVWLDIQHTEGNQYLTWNKDNYGNPKLLTKNISDSERKVVVIVDPHLKADQGYRVYADAAQAGLLVKSPDGVADYHGKCWPGMSGYIDFTRGEARDFWHQQLQHDRYEASSTDLFVWNDMNEPSVFDGPEVTMPKSNRHGTHGQFEHREIHNIYGQYFHRSTYEALQLRDPGHRPFVLSRSFFVGSHKFGPVWTGDNKASWDHLKISVPMLLSLAVSGLSFSGADVGGFEGHPSKELYIRWTQLGALAYPFFRSHAYVDSPNREPWTYDEETLDIVTSAIRLRYTLIPYWYTLASRYAMDGLPMIRPLWFDHMHDPESFTNPIALEEELMVGDALLVRGVFVENAREVSVYLPSGVEWYDFNNNSRPPIQGGKEYAESVALTHIPMFVKAGSIIPLKLTRRKSTLGMRNDRLSLKIWLTGGDGPQTASGLVYIDDEFSTQYEENNAFALIRIDYSDGLLTFTLVKGNLRPGVNVIDQVELIGLRDTTNVLIVADESMFTVERVVDGSRGVPLNIVRESDSAYFELLEL